MAFKYPWTNLHELNLDWILSQIRQLTKQIAKFTGLTASAHSVPYGSDPTVDVTGGTGNDPYNLDFGIPDSASSAVNTVNGQSGDVVLTASDIGLGNVDNVQQYSATNPPPYPVTSVNGQTGDVTVPDGVKQTAPLTPTSTHVTLNEAYMVKMGNLVTYSFEFTLDSTANYALLDGFETPELGQSGIAMPVLVMRGTTILDAQLASSGSFGPTGQFSAGTYQCVVTYITAL